MTRHAGLTDYIGVVELRGPRDGVVTNATGLNCRQVPRAFSVSSGSIVAAFAVLTTYRAVIKLGNIAEEGCIMATLTRCRSYNMVGWLSLGGNIIVATCAVAGKAVKSPCEVALLTFQVYMETIKCETRGKVIERFKVFNIGKSARQAGLN